ncbi:hypothetical protein J6590_029633 [Homalodisca vitripennis]|nr:hypothetical protein J6590_029633 [Homalodisca vitripennis]
MEVGKEHGGVDEAPREEGAMEARDGPPYLQHEPSVVSAASAPAEPMGNHCWRQPDCFPSSPRGSWSWSLIASCSTCGPWTCVAFLQESRHSLRRDPNDYIFQLEEEDY